MLQMFHVENFRVFKYVKIDLCSNLNFFCGNNGAGKSSLIEAITILTRGKSHRSNNLAFAIRHDEEFFRVGGRIESLSGFSQIGIEKSYTQLKIRLNEQNVNSLSKLAEIIPVQVIDSEILRIVHSGPVIKRSFLNWGCFHFDQIYRETWKNYNKIHKQINSTLKLQDKNLLRSWYPSLISSANILHQQRLLQVDKLNLILNEHYRGWFGNNQIRITYRKGWSEKNDFHESILLNEKRNLFNETLTIGPHRANLVLKIGDKDASTNLSKGQQKMLAMAMYLSQVKILKTYLKIKPIILIDDLVSELDKYNVELVLHDINTMDLQTIVTSIELSAIKKSTNGKQADFFTLDSGIISPQ